MFAKQCDDEYFECLDDEDEASCEADFTYSNGKRNYKANYSRVFVLIKCVQLSWQLSW